MAWHGTRLLHTTSPTRLFRGSPSRTSCTNPTRSCRTTGLFGLSWASSKLGSRSGAIPTSSCCTRRPRRHRQTVLLGILSITASTSASLSGLAGDDVGSAEVSETCSLHAPSFTVGVSMCCRLALSCVQLNAESEGPRLGRLECPSPASRALSMPFSAVMSVITHLNGTDEIEDFMGVRANIVQPELCRYHQDVNKRHRRSDFGWAAQFRPPAGLYA